MKVAQDNAKSTKSALEKRKAAAKKRKERVAKAKKRRKKYLQQIHTNNPTKRILLQDICRAIRHHFPDLLERLGQVIDVRKRKIYGAEELLLSAILLFVFKEASRNSMNNNRSEGKFAKNYVSAFGVRLAHMDTVDTFLRQLPAEELESIKIYLFKQLLERRVFHKFRLFSKYFTVSIDATGLGSYEEEPYEGCTFRRYKAKKTDDKQSKEQPASTSEDKQSKEDTPSAKGATEEQLTSPNKLVNKQEASAELDKGKAELDKGKAELDKGKKVWFQPVLEAKLVCPNGFSISIATEWILNTGEWDKQDCELKAFKRLADKIKSDFPRLSICIVADALYPNKSVFEICKQKGWPCILTLKDGQLKAIWDQVAVFDERYSKNKETTPVIKNKRSNITCTYRWINDIAYQGHSLNWVECIRVERNIQTGQEQINRFVHVTNFAINPTNVVEVSSFGRLRWKIENEGFNTQKNGGYQLEHKFSRKSLTATKNYFQALQIAHLINQLVELSSTTKKLLKGKMTIKHLWKLLIAFMFFGDFTEKQFRQSFQPTQFRYPL